VELYCHSPIRLHDVVLNYLGTGTAVPLPYRSMETGCGLGLVARPCEHGNEPCGFVNFVEFLD
jgi:hypothetical protein